MNKGNRSRTIYICPCLHWIFVIDNLDTLEHLKVTRILCCNCCMIMTISFTVQVKIAPQNEIGTSIIPVEHRKAQTAFKTFV